MRKTIKKNSEVIKQMKEIYCAKNKENIDWMGFTITNKNKPSYHHIKKAEDLRKTHESDEATISNGAYLGKKSHELLHRIEYKDKELYDSWNYVFMVINKMNIYPIEDIWKIIYELQRKSLELEKNTKVYKKTRKN